LVMSIKSELLFHCAFKSYLVYLRQKSLKN